MRIGAETYYLTSQFHVAQENVPVQFRSSAMQFLIGFRIDFQCLAVLGQITENRIQQIRKVLVEYAHLRIRSITCHIIIMPHDVETVPEPYHLLVQCLQIIPVGLTPILALVISAPERVRIIEIMH